MGCPLVPVCVQYVIYRETRGIEIEDSTAAVLMVDSYGGKETPGEMALNSKYTWLTHVESFWGQACIYHHFARCLVIAA